VTTAAGLRKLLAPYVDPRGGYRCPVCGGPVRVLDVRPPRIIGCHGRELSDLADQAAGYLDGARAAA
jgi:hypothetical protein